MCTVLVLFSWLFLTHCFSVYLGLHRQCDVDGDLHGGLRLLSRNIKYIQEKDVQLERTLRTLDFTIPFLIAALMLAPIMSPFLALPLTQEVKYIHFSPSPIDPLSKFVWNTECQSVPTFIYLKGQSNFNLSSTISFHTIPLQPQLEGQPYPPQKQHVYDFDFFNVPPYKVLRYRPVDNTTLPQWPEPSIKTMFIDVSQRKFCSSNSTELNPITHPEAICTDASGTYNESPHLFFSVHTLSPPKSIYVRTQDSEYAYPDSPDAPSFVLRSANADGTLRPGPDLLRSALTKRNDHSLLLVCSSSLATPELLGPSRNIHDRNEPVCPYH
jgi:hypothetical protein